MTKPRFIPLDFHELPEPEMLNRSASFLAEMTRRRTVRHFSDRAVPRAIIENAVRTAASAPSGANMQPWHFVCVKNQEVKRRIREAAEVEERAFYERRATKEWLAAVAPLGTTPDKPFLEEASWLIAIFLERSTLSHGGKTLKTYYARESIGIATGLLIASLHLSGVATLTHTPSPMRFLNEILGRPRNEEPFLLLVAGYPASEAKVPNISRKPLESIADFV